MILVKVDSSNLKAKLPILLQQARNPRQVLLGVGREAGNQLKIHFRGKERTNVNKLNPDRRQHFWRTVSQSVQAPELKGSTSVTVAINDLRFAQKLFGGTIVAKRFQNLAIPVSPDAYGRSASDGHGGPGTFTRETGLKLFVLRQGGTAANSKGTIILATERGAGIEVEYVLKYSVNQKADPTALPDMSAGSPFETALINRGQTILERQIKDGGLN